VERLLGPAAGLEQRGEVGAGSDLGDLELDRSDPGVPHPGAIAVAVGGAGLGALVGSSADLGADLDVHDHLGERLDAFPQDVGVVFLEKLADERRYVHAVPGHCLLLIRLRPQMRMAMAFFI
jgi:hypothetical protein